MEAARGLSVVYTCMHVHVPICARGKAIGLLFVSMNLKICLCDQLEAVENYSVPHPVMPCAILLWTCAYSSME